VEGLSHRTDERLARRRFVLINAERRGIEREPILENFHKEGRTEVDQDSHVF
jgi:hypothetical protein